MRRFLVSLALLGCATTHTAEEPSLRDPSPAEGAALRADLAETLIGRGSDDAALPILRQALGENPSSARLHTLLGIVLRDKGLRTQAEKELQIALVLARDFAPAHAALGVLYDQEHKHVEALREHREAVRLAPSCVRFWNNLGFSLYLGRHDREAVEAYETALRLDPGARPVYNNLGFAYARLGDEAAALRAFRQATGDTGARKNLALAKEMR